MKVLIWVTKLII